jgi:[ribosomal protein S5]-alanine N-acetyltransferase
MKAPFQVDTPRLTLVQPAPSDAAAVFERYASDPEMTRFLGWPRHQTLEDTRAFLKFSASEWERWPAGPYLIRSRSGGGLLGGTGLRFETRDRAVTGYVLACDAWGQGYATEALRTVTDVARRVGVVHLSALCHPEHHRSWRVLEKCGFTRDTNWTGQTEFPNLEPAVQQDVLAMSSPGILWESTCLGDNRIGGIRAEARHIRPIRDPVWSGYPRRRCAARVRT